MVVQVDPSGETWIWKAVAYAASQSRVTWQMDWDEPRSTSSHCGSEKALDQRVPVFPSTAFEAGKVAFSSEEAVAVFPGRYSQSRSCWLSCRRPGTPTTNSRTG